MKLAKSLCDKPEQFYIMKQGQHQLLQQYHGLFSSHVEVMEQVRVPIPDALLVNKLATANGRLNNAHDADWK